MSVIIFALSLVSGSTSSILHPSVAGLSSAGLWPFLFGRRGDDRWLADMTTDWTAEPLRDTLQFVNPLIGTTNGGEKQRFKRAILSDAHGTGHVFPRATFPYGE
jgi:hypothetical protein